LAENNKTGVKCALKISNDGPDSEESMNMHTDEAKIMSEISHHNIIKMLEYNDNACYTTRNGETSTRFSIAYELARNDLFDYIAQGGELKENDARYYFHQIVGATEFMHSKGISHRDLKHENILLDDNYDIKIADFGFATHSISSDSYKGSGYYMAPEIHINKKYNTQCSDIFSLGVILFVMVFNRPPFPSTLGTNSFLKAIKDNKIKSFWKMHTKGKAEGIEHYSEDLIHLISGMLQVEPVHRISISEIKQHPWFKGELPSKAEITENLDKRQQLVLDAGIMGGLVVPADSIDPDEIAQNAHRGLDDSDVSSLLILQIN
jgi:serine/threonine protein kinase